MTQMFRKRPIEVRAAQWNGPGTVPWASGSITEEYADYCTLLTHHGEADADRGDWIIQGVNGEIYPCKDDVFRKTYEPVESEAAPAADSEAE